ncbi:MAG: glycosyltransferase family 4 protein [Enterococcus casseliflavus]|nr:glycosyltransferase family 4 protein [Enterococcus casseliflavus]
MKDILVISNYWHFPKEKASSRYNTIINMFAEQENKVELITSNFYHTRKQKRVVNEVFPYKVTLLDERGYRKNISLKRIASHNNFTENVLKYLRDRDLPDVIYLFVPPIGLGDKVIEFANHNNIKIVVDVLDLWPEAFKMILPFPNFVNNIILYPMTKRAKKLYSSADRIITVSKTYSKFIEKCTLKHKEVLPVYIGIDVDLISDLMRRKVTSSNQDFIISYAGMLGHSYDIKLVIDAISILKDQYGISNIVFDIYGIGPQKEIFENHAKTKKVNCRFKGFKPYHEMLNGLIASDILVNPIVPNAAQSIINKHADYAASGRPVLNTQDSDEYCRLVEEYEAGLNSPSGNRVLLAENLLKLYRNPTLRNKMGENHRKLCEQNFDRKKTYKDILDVVIKDSF